MMFFGCSIPQKFAPACRAPFPRSSLMPSRSMVSDSTGQSMCAEVSAGTLLCIQAKRNLAGGKSCASD